MLCALTVRRLKPGSFDAFAERFTPGDDAPPPGWTRFHLLRGTSSADEVVTFGFFEGTLDELEASQRDHGYSDRVAAIDELVDDVVSNGVYDVVRVLEVQSAR